MNKKRCDWVNTNKPQIVAYHDKEWGIPVRNDKKLFEMLTLEGAQVGLNWETILKKRQGYQLAFKDFDPNKVANLRDSYLKKELNNPNIIRNRLKVFSVKKNAKVFLEIQKEFGSFSKYLRCLFHINEQDISKVLLSAQAIHSGIGLFLILYQQQ